MGRRIGRVASLLEADVLKVFGPHSQMCTHHAALVRQRLGVEFCSVVPEPSSCSREV